MKNEYEIGNHGRHFAVREQSGELVCLTVYRKGAEEVVRRLTAQKGSLQRTETTSVSPKEDEPGAGTPPVHFAVAEGDDDER
jgi:hypothetical protein